MLTGVFLCAVIFDRGVAGPFNFPKITALLVFTVAAFGLWLMEALQGRTEPVLFPLGLLGGSFVLACGIATAFSRTPVVSFFGWNGRNSGFVQYALYVSVFFLIAQLYWRRPERLKELMYTVGAASTIAVVYIVLQWLDLDPFRWGTPGRSGPTLQRFGTLGNSNFAGGFLGATSPWLLFAFWRARSVRWKALVVAWTAVTLWGLLLTESRGGLVAFALAAGVAAVAFRSRFPRWLFVTGAVVAVVLVIGAAVAFLRPSGLRPEVAVPGTRNVLRTETFEFRTVWWRAALSIFAHNPIVGTGPDTFVVVFPQYAPPESAKLRAGPRADKPHNVFLDHAASMGGLGVATYGALLSAAMVWGVRRMRTAGRREGDLLGTSLAIVGGYAGQAFFSIDVPPVAMVVWVGLGGVAALADPRLVRTRERGSDPSSSARPRRMTFLRWSAVGLVALLTAVGVVGGMRPWRADRVSRAARDTARADDFVLARRLRAEAVALYPVDPIYQLSAASGLLQEAEEYEGEQRREVMRDGIAYIERANELQPHFHLTKVSLGEALSRLGLSGELSAFYGSSVALEEATELAPYDWRVFVKYADMLNRWGRAEGRPERHCLALEQLQRALELRGGDPSTWRSLAVTYTYLGRLDSAAAAIQQSLILDADVESSVRIREQILERRRQGDVREIRCQ